MTTKNISKGNIITSKNVNTALTFKTGGIHPKEYFRIINKKVKRDLKKGHVLNLGDLK